MRNIYEAVKHDLNAAQREAFRRCIVDTDVLEWRRELERVLSSSSTTTAEAYLHEGLGPRRAAEHLEKVAGTRYVQGRRAAVAIAASLQGEGLAVTLEYLREQPQRFGRLIEEDGEGSAGQATRRAMERAEGNAHFGEEQLQAAAYRLAMETAARTAAQRPNAVAHALGVLRQYERGLKALYGPAHEGARIELERGLRKDKQQRAGAARRRAEQLRRRPKAFGPLAGEGEATAAVSGASRAADSFSAWTGLRRQDRAAGNAAEIFNAQARFRERVGKTLRELPPPNVLKRRIALALDDLVDAGRSEGEKKGAKRLRAEALSQGLSPAWHIGKQIAMGRDPI